MKPKLPAAVYALGMTSLLNDAASEMIYPLMPVFLTMTLGASAVTLGFIEGAADATASLLKLVSGYVSDRVGRRKPLVVLGYLIASAARPLIAFARTPFVVLAIRLVDRFGKGLRQSPRDALIAEVAPPELQGRAFGVHEAMDHAGAIVGPMIAFALLGIGLSLPSIFLLSAIPAFAACAVVAIVVREPERRPAAGAIAAAPDAATSAAAGATAAPDAAVSRSDQSASASRPFMSRPFVAYLGAVVLFTLGNSSDAFLLLRAYDAGLPVIAMPLLWALHHAVKSVASATGGGLADRIGHRRTLVMGWLVYAAIYAGFAFVTSSEGIVGLFVLYGLYFALVGGAQKALVSQLVPAHARGRGFGAYHFAVGASTLPASLLFGVLYQRFGAPTAFLTGAGLALAAIAVLPLSRAADPSDPSSNKT